MLRIAAWYRYWYIPAFLAALGFFAVALFFKDPSDPPLSAAAKAAIVRLSASLAPMGAEDHRVDRYADVRVETPLLPQEEAQFNAEWQAAAAAAAALDTPAEVLAAGYMPPRAIDRQRDAVLHWINWELIEQPFDPARPSMLLFSTQSDGEELVGFSYVLQSAEAPAGFAGPNDQWHQHGGICVANGQGVADNVSPGACEGDWLPGGDMWMLHAWVVPGHENPIGRFSTSNPPACPDHACPTGVVPPPPPYEPW
mgnify:FL=1